MKLYLIPDYCRVEGVTGRFVEEAFAADFPKYEKTIPLITARNQFVSFQLIVDVQEEGKLDELNFSFSPLTGKRGTVAPDYEVFTQWFHDIDGRKLPDLLLPWGKTNHPFRIPLDPDYLPDQRVGALWIDLFVPAETARGLYRGTLEVTADGHRQTFEIELKVYASAVPNESLMIADFNNYADSISDNHPHLKNNENRYRDGSFFEVERQYVTLAREHRCLFDHLHYGHSGKPIESFAPELTGSGKHIRVSSWELFDRHFGPYLDGSAFADSRRGPMPIEFLFTPFNLGWPANFKQFGKPGYKTEFRRILWEYARHFEEKGWTQTVNEIMFNEKKEYRFFPTTQDEIWYENDEEMFDAMLDIMQDTYEHSGAKFVVRADSSNHYGRHAGEKYLERVSMWVAAMTMYSWYPENILPLKNQGSILWTYGWYGEGMTVDLPLNAALTQPLLCFMTGATGFCSFWNTLSPGEDFLKTPFVNGGQAIFYPGTPFDYQYVLPSLRLKSLRNHMQLMDLMMTVDGLDCESVPNRRGDLEQIVNECYGYQSKEDWFSPRPPFADTLPPRYWDWGPNGVGKYQKLHHEGLSPAVIGTLRQRVLSCMG